MRLVVTMYHRASAGRHGNAPEVLDAHFATIAARHHCVLPGDTLVDDRLNVCLSFDDGHFDFYAVVYPMLVKHGLRALLAVPVSFIHESSRRTTEARLALCRSRTPHRASDSEAFCSWDELTELAASGHVSIAAHGMTHRRLDEAGVDLESEIRIPKSLLSARLGKPVESLVLPYGRFDDRTLACAASEYRYTFRIGSADNDGWRAPLIYRVNADEMRTPEEPFRRTRLFGYALRRRWNHLRNR
jgi:peptidoglycan/xylan/chitin deacetylase (PgdA/CDA1 family)